MRPTVLVDGHSALAARPFVHRASDTKVAWRCEHQGQSVDFDVDASQTAKQTASEGALTLFGANNTSWSWANASILCGSEWAMGDTDQANKSETRG